MFLCGLQLVIKPDFWLHSWSGDCLLEVLNLYEVPQFHWAKIQLNCPKPHPLAMLQCTLLHYSGVWWVQRRIHTQVKYAGIKITCYSWKPPLVDSPNKGHLQLSGQHDMHKLNFTIQTSQLFEGQQITVKYCSKSCNSIGWCTQIFVDPVSRTYVTCTCRGTSTICSCSRHYVVAMNSLNEIFEHILHSEERFSKRINQLRERQ